MSWSTRQLILSVSSSLRSLWFIFYVKHVRISIVGRFLSQAIAWWPKNLNCSVGRIFFFFNLFQPGEKKNRETISLLYLQSFFLCDFLLSYPPTNTTMHCKKLKYDTVYWKTFFQAFGIKAVKYIECREIDRSNHNTLHQGSSGEKMEMFLFWSI